MGRDCRWTVLVASLAACSAASFAVAGTASIELQQVLDSAEPLSPRSDLFAAGLDSMGIMQLLLAIEDRFGVAIDPSDLSRDNFSSAEKIAALIAALIADKQAAAGR